MSPDVGWVETKGFVSSTEAAGRTDLYEEKGAGDAESFSSDVDGVDSCLWVVTGDGLVDSRDQRVETLDGAHDRVDCASLRPEVHLGPILLIDKRHRHVFGRCKSAIWRQCLLVLVPEEDVPHVKSAGATWFASRRVLAGSHCEEESHDRQVGCGGLCRVVADRVAGSAKFEHSTEELRCDRFLTVGRWVQVCESIQESRDARAEGLSSLDVEGALLETLPKRRSHVACGLSDSV